MIRFFPTPYPDELLYSVCARYSALTSFGNTRVTMRTLFGMESLTATCLLPSHLGHLIAALPDGHRYTVDELIDHLTVLPFFSPFLPAERVRRLREGMCAGVSGSTLYLRSGLNASRIRLPLYLRFCPVCVQTDRRRFHECYWHRIHQVPGVEVCPTHEVLLETTSVRIRNPRNRRQFIPAEQAIQPIPPRGLNKADRNHQVLLQLASDAAWVLHHPTLKPSLEVIRNRYLWLLAERQHATYTGHIRGIKELHTQFRAAFPRAVLRRFGSRYSEQYDLDWLVSLLRSPQKSLHPLYHLLMIQFLGHTAESFFALPEQFPPFGEGPWPCLNPVAEHYAELRITTCAVKFTRLYHSAPIGTFSCDCGFVYSRTGPDRTPEDRYRLGQVQAFGRMWEARLEAQWADAALSLREIARRLGVDPSTVKSHAVLLNLPYPRGGMRSSRVPRLGQKRKPVVQLDVLDTYRTAWLAAIAAHPHAGVQGVLQRARAAYSYLHRNDRNWLHAHWPTARQRVRTKSRVDWGDRDAELAFRVPAAVERLLRAAGRPTQLTMAALQRELGVSALYLKKLPVSRELLSKSVENREMFAIRRVRWASEQFTTAGIRPQRCELVRRAGLRWELTVLPAVAQAITEALTNPLPEAV